MAENRINTGFFNKFVMIQQEKGKYGIWGGKNYRKSKGWILLNRAL